MTKKNKELLKKYKKANKEYRKTIVKKAGFSSEEEYLNSLKGVKKIKSTDCLDVVIAFDTTGSMSSYISSVRKHAKQVVTDLFKNTPNLKMKIVAFGDYCDMESATKFGNAYQESELTDNVNDLIKFIDNAKNTGGGDTPEFYELVIKKITEETPWRDGQRTVMLIADFDPHEVGYSYGNIIKNAQIDWREEAKKSAKLGIKWDTLRILPQETWYEELSKITGGICLNFKNSERISEIVVGTTYARASSYSDVSRAAFSSSMSKTMASGDSELIGAYKQINTLLEE